jgi:spore coat polysaccharide biosynthesis predicted glycosyltransferase SpsG
MKFLFICKASTKHGLGHLSRSKSLAEGIAYYCKDCLIDFRIVGEPYVKNLLSDFLIHYLLYNDEKDIKLDKNYDIVIFDTLSIGSDLLSEVKSCSRLLVSISPIFDQMHHMHLLINRTRYHSEEIEGLPLTKIGGPEYTIIQSSCHKIKTNDYKAALQRKKLPVAISMGGADAANKTLKLISILKKLEIPLVFWVMLGEGYKHSYDELVREIVSGTPHEIILAKTNHSMWSVLENTALLLTTSGVTAYEAVYAGLPSIVFYEQQDRYFLVRELIEHQVVFNGGLFSNVGLSLNQKIIELTLQPEILLKMHKIAKKFIRNNATKNILNAIKRETRIIK